ncbi:hypothetical protein [Nocardia wallacei]|uniref:hypothetical protein n=1 Tax=Nocardia wallacei TaxID=480035 RepID=UPI0024581380|nr:hypothetical protein [Nocardia wallacei]
MSNPRKWTGRHAQAGSPVWIAEQKRWAAPCVCGRRFRDRDEAASEKRLGDHVAQSNRPRCPTPHRRAFGSRFDAERALVRMWQRRDGQSVTGAEECACGAWHHIRPRRTAVQTDRSAGIRALAG